MPFLIIILVILFLPLMAIPVVALFVGLFVVIYICMTISDYIAKRNPKYAAWRENDAQRKKGADEWEALKSQLSLIRGAQTQST